MLQKFILTVAFLTFLTAPAFAGFEEGKAAYDNKDWTTAITHLRPLAENGDDRAMIVLANMYSDGHGVLQSHVEAYSLYKRAAVEKNNTEAMVAIGAMYNSGIGLPTSFKTSLEWFKRAALLGDETAAFFYPMMLYRGNQSLTDDVKPDFYNAYKWFKIANRIVKDPQMRSNALTLSERVSLQSLKTEEIAKADKEANEWIPAKIEELGPIPAEPAMSAPVSTPEPAVTKPKN